MVYPIPAICMSSEMEIKGKEYNIYIIQTDIILISHVNLIFFWENGKQDRFFSTSRFTISGQISSSEK